MIPFEKYPSARLKRFAFTGPIGHSIIYSYPVPADKIWYLLQASVGQQAGHDGSYYQGASIAICYPVAPPFKGIWRHDLIRGQQLNTTPLVGWTGEIIMTPGETVSGRVDRISKDHGISLLIRYCEIDASEVLGCNLSEFDVPMPKVIA